MLVPPWIMRNLPSCSQIGGQFHWWAWKIESWLCSSLKRDIPTLYVLAVSVQVLAIESHRNLKGGFITSQGWWHGEWYSDWPCSTTANSLSKQSVIFTLDFLLFNNHREGLSHGSPLPAPLSHVIRDPLKCQGTTNGGGLPPIMALEMDLSAYRLALSLHPFIFIFFNQWERVQNLLLRLFDLRPFLFPHLTFKSTHVLSSLLTNWQKAYLTLTSLFHWLSVFLEMYPELCIYIYISNASICRIVLFLILT